jgi:hypothetical protein
MKRVILSSLIISIIIAGCLASGTVVYVFDLVGGWASNGSMQWRQVDLSDNSDFQDNKDKLKSVDAIVLVGDIINLGASDLTADIYISDNLYILPEQVIANATQIFTSPTVPAQDTLHINWNDGMNYIMNLSTLEDQVKGDGQFYIYAISSSSSPVIYDLNLIATLTVGL